MMFPHTKEEILLLDKEGWPVDRIAKATGETPYNITRFLATQAKVKENAARIKARDERMAKLYQEGKSVREVGEDAGLTYDGAICVLKRLGIYKPKKLKTQRDAPPVARKKEPIVCKDQDQSAIIRELRADIELMHEQRRRRWVRLNEDLPANYMQRQVTMRLSDPGFGEVRVVIELSGHAWADGDRVRQQSLSLERAEDAVDAALSFLLPLPKGTAR
jgi:hypothetical protein